MAQRKAAPRALAGVVLRGAVYYWRREHEKLPGGAINRSLRTRDLAVANAYAGSLQTLVDRGDWSVLARFAAGEIHVSDVHRLVREGDWQALKRLHSEGLALGAEARDYLVRERATAAAKRTHRVKESALRLAVASFGAERRMHTVTKAEAEAYLHRESRPGVPVWAPNSQSSHRKTLAGLWDWSMERELEAAEQVNAAPTLTRNPWRDAKTPPRPQTRFAFLTPEQARALLANDQVAGTPRAAFFATALYAGLRAGELAHLRTDVDVDLVHGFLLVQGRKGRHEWEPKTKGSARKVAIIPALQAYLALHRERFAGKSYFFAGEHRDAPPVGSTMQLWTEEAFEAAGLKYGRAEDALTLHSLRHSFATWLIAAGVPITTVARFMGDTVEVVLAVYAHHLPQQEEVALGLLQDFASGRGTR